MVYKTVGGTQRVEVNVCEHPITPTTTTKVNKSCKFTVIDSKDLGYFRFLLTYSTILSVDQPAHKKKVESNSASAAAPAVDENWHVSSMTVEEKVALAMSVGEETLTVEELTALFTARPHPVVYDGFEPSG